MTAQRLDRRRFLARGVGAAAGVGLGLLAEQRAQGGIWVLRQGFLSLFQNLGYWGRYNDRANYLTWATGGKALDRLIRSFKSYPSGYPYNKAVEFQLTGKTSGTHIPDGQCVALVRACTAVGYTGAWKRGANVLTPGSTYIPIGAVIARFALDSAGVPRYVGGHTGLFAGYRSTGSGGGISIWHQNVEGQFVTWRSLPLGGRGVFDPREYYLVQT